MLVIAISMVIAWWVSRLLLPRLIYPGVKWQYSAGGLSSVRFPIIALVLMKKPAFAWANTSSRLFVLRTMLSIAAALLLSLWLGDILEGLAMAATGYNVVPPTMPGEFRTRAELGSVKKQNA